MAKARVTSKWVKGNFNCLSIGFADLQYLLRYKTPQYYTAGIYGWNYDVYTLDLPDFSYMAICTGYRGMPETVKTRSDKHDIIRRYEEQAQKMIRECFLTSETLKDDLDALLKDFLIEVLQ